MSETKHTPGPWQQKSSEYAQYEIIANIDGPDEGRYSWDTICQVNEDLVRATANARLIAAAPELLDTLRGIAAVMAESEGVAGYHLNGNVAKWNELSAFANVEDLIAKHEEKAEGRS